MVSPMSSGSSGTFAVASHDALFHQEAKAECDACGLPFAADDDDGFALSGKGLFVWTRGADHVRYEEPPLCPHCATAIGVSALTRWAIEEEEG